MPVGVAWLWMVPVALAGALMGGAWAPPLQWRQGIAPTGFDLAAILILPLVSELVFRGLAHGLMSAGFSGQGARGRWFVSWPVAISTVLYAFWTLPILHPPLASTDLVWFALPVSVSVVGTLLFGLAVGLIRERSGSLLAPLAVHYLGLAAVVAAMASGLG